MFLVFQELAVLSDFDHLEENEREKFELGDLIFKKEFYSSGMCVSATGEEVRLKKFARSWLEITEAGDEESENFEIFCADSPLNDDWIP